MAENPRIEELRRRVQADSASIAFAALAEEFRRIGRYQDAIDTCRTGLQRHPAYLSARVTLGRSLIETGDYDAAREELQTVLRSAPENIAAIRGLEQIHERLGHSTEMDPDLAALADESIRRAPPPAPEPEKPEASGSPPDLPPIKHAPNLHLGAFDLPLTAAASEPHGEDEPFDIFAGALERPADTSEPPFDGLRAAPSSVEGPPPLAFEPATIAFEAPVIPPKPDSQSAARLVRLERFLGAIHTARHA